jgi:SSS family transporter
MEIVFNARSGLILLALYGVSMITLGMWVARGRLLNKTEFLLAGRNIKVFAGAMSIAASWIWAPALFVGAQKAFEQGVPGIFWFSFPNMLALMVFAPLALQIRKLMPGGFTLPELMRKRHGRGVHILYLVQFFGLQVCSFAVQILAGASLIRLLTGLNFHLIAVILTTIVVVYSVIGGFRASVTTDLLQMGLIFGAIVLTVPWVVNQTGGMTTVAGGLGGITGEYANLFNPWVAYSFGISATIGLLAGPIGDQQHWQRAYALHANRDVIKTFVLAALLFVLVPLSLSLLGFVAANPAVSAGWTINSTQMIGPITVANVLPTFMMVVFSVMLLSGLCSTLDSVLSASSSLVSVDFFPENSDTDEKIEQQNVRRARWGMLLLVVLALGVASIPGLQIVHLWLFYGTFRASTMIPTVLTLFWQKLNSRSVFVAILASMLLGAPVYALGAMLGNPHLSVLGSVLVVVIGLITCGLWSRWRPHAQPVETN